MGNGGLSILPQKKMIMIGHQAVGNNGNLILLAILFNQLEQVKIILFVKEDVLPVRAPVVDVVIVADCEFVFSYGHGSPQNLPEVQNLREVARQSPQA